MVCINIPPGPTLFLTAIMIGAMILLIVPPEHTTSLFYLSVRNVLMLYGGGAAGWVLVDFIRACQ